MVPAKVLPLKRYTNMHNNKLSHFPSWRWDQECQDHSIQCNHRTSVVEAHKATTVCSRYLPQSSTYWKVQYQIKLNWMYFKNSAWTLCDRFGGNNITFKVDSGVGQGLIKCHLQLVTIISSAQHKPSCSSRCKFFQMNNAVAAYSKVKESVEHKQFKYH